MVSSLVEEQEPRALVGSFRSFGERGPVYEVLGQINPATVHIVVVESGEELDYPVNEAEGAPEAR
jgi:hypothetical protein